MRTMVDSAAWLYSRRPEIERAIAPQLHEVQHVWTAQIVMLELLPGCTRRWRYSATPVLANVTTLAAVADTSHRYATAAEQVHCYNLYEWPITGTTQDPTYLADGTLVANIPAGFAVVPVRGIVRMTSLRGEDGVPLHIFDRANGIDGVCA